MRGNAATLCRTALLLSWLALVPPARANEADTRRELEVPRTVEGLLTEDVDGDGTEDVLVLGEREVWVYPGRPGDLPAAAPRWKVTVPADVSFVDALPGTEAARDPALLVLGSEGVRRLRLEDGTTVPPAEGLDEGRLPWRDWLRASFADLVRPDGTLLLPDPRGWRWRTPDGATGLFRVERFEQVEPPGDFLEDDAVVTQALSTPYVRRGRDTPLSIWASSGNRLVADHEGERVEHDLSFLPPEGTRQLVELTGDGAPEVVHAQGTNQERTFAFFRPPRPGEAGSLRPAAAVVRLSGFCLDPDFTDLDGDGRVDFVVTTIPIDARNTARALGGQVTAQTRAFLNRSATEATLFPRAPDASMVSDVGVAIRFSAGGTIDVVRSFTILVTGDYDGDGRKDLAIRTGPQTLTVHPGVEAGVWAPRGRIVAIPPVGDSPNVEGRPADVDGDGGDEVLLLYRKPWQGRDRLWVVRP